MDESGFDYGIKLSQIGKNVQSAGDAELIFNSSWGNMPIVLWGRVQKLFVDNNTPRKIFDHNLGYVPLIITVGVGTQSTYQRTAISWDNKSVYFNSQNPSSGGNTVNPINIDFYYYIFAIDITKPYTARMLKDAVNIDPDDKDFGIRLAKRGKSVFSTDMRDFVLHSATRSPMIHAVMPGSVASGQSSITFTHQLPYNPMVFGFRYTTDTVAPNTWSSTTGFADMRSAGQSITMYGQQNSMFSVVILKDPFNITEGISVVA